MPARNSLVIDTLAADARSRSRFDGGMIGAMSRPAASNTGGTSLVVTGLDHHRQQQQR